MFTPTSVIIFALIASINGYETVPQPYHYITDWYPDMPIDHFSYTDNRTFNMRFLYNDTWYKEGGPIFFYTGNEGDITSFGNNTGFMYDIAADFDALLVFGEHRYYGETLPFGNETFSDLSNLGYLSSEQALADYAQFLRWFKNDYYPQTNNSKVVAFGGSYGGLLSAWFRMKYPHIVIGSLAAAAPMMMFPGLSNCNVQPSILTNNFKNSGNHCADIIKMSWSILAQWSTTADGRQNLNKLFRLCPDSLINTADDVNNKLNPYLYSVYDSYSVVDYPYPTNFFVPLPGWPVKEACKFLTDPNASDVDILTGIYNVLNMYTNYTGDLECNTLTTAASPIDEVPWHFQLCTELVSPICSDNNSMIFEFDWDPIINSLLCEKQYHVKPRMNWVVTEYGANKLQAASNIIFSNGDLDPCSGDGILTPIEGVDSIHIVYITNAAHHYDLRGGNDADTPEVLQARQTEYNIIKGWLSTSADTTSSLPATTSSLPTTTAIPTPSSAFSFKPIFTCFLSFILLLRFI